MHKYFVYCRKSTEEEDRQVLSIDSQKQELLDLFAKRQGLSIADILEESCSAKTPGRPVFNELIRRIERGEANGIIAWHPDRLARNSIDGGRIIYLIDRGKLADLKFHAYGFDNSPEGVMMLGILFAQSKHYSDKLSKDVRRGIRAKIQQGWASGPVPIGYLNEPVNHIVVKDSDRFQLVRRIWELFLKRVPVSQITEIARRRWQLTTVKRKLIGGALVTQSGIYGILSNPFYCGLLRHNGQLHPGKHPPMVSIDDFQRAQALLSEGNSKIRPQKREFAFTGLIKCGECGAMVTAEEKINRQGHHYVYYHCGKRKGPCSQKCLRLEDLERQIAAFLRSIAIPDRFARWAIKHVARQHQDDNATGAAIQASMEKGYMDCGKQLDALLSMRLKDLLSDDEYTNRKNSLLLQQQKLRQEIDEAVNDADRWLEPARQLISLASQAEYLFLDGDLRKKRLILETVGSNLTLKDKRLRIQAKRPFQLLGNGLRFRGWLATANDVRTFCAQLRGNSDFSNDFAKINQLAQETGCFPPLSSSSIPSRRRRKSPEVGRVSRLINKRLYGSRGAQSYFSPEGQA